MVCKRFRRRGCGECGSRRLPSHRGNALALQRVPMGAALSTARRARGFHADPPADRGLFFRLLAAPRLSVNRILSHSNW